MKVLNVTDNVSLDRKAELLKQFLTDKEEVDYSEIKSSIKGFKELSDDDISEIASRGGFTVKDK